MFIRKISRKVHIYMIGKLQNTITVQQLYEYALLHNYLNADVSVVLDIMNRERTSNSHHTIATIHNTHIFLVFYYFYTRI